MPKAARLIQQGAHRIQGRFTLGVIGVLIDDENRILLVEHVFHPKVPWGLPGGWVNRNEPPTEAVAREFHEETGLRIRATQPLDIWTNNFLRNHVNMAFTVESLEAFNTNEIALSAELLAYQWVTRDALPPILPDHLRVIDLALAYRQQGMLNQG
jgi:ADP-ribose pyrophosphatase YjhB (NUDIX family)